MFMSSSWIFMSFIVRPMCGRPAFVPAIILSSLEASNYDCSCLHEQNSLSRFGAQTAATLRLQSG
jgi:hypothetical protein